MQSKAGGVLRVHKYYEDIDFLTEFNEEKLFAESSTKYFSYTFVYFGEDFGVAFKQDGSSLFYRISLPYLNLQVTVLNPNGFFASDKIALLTLLQRREDPNQTDLTESRDVYGYYDNNFIYRFEANALTDEIKAVEQIQIPSPAAFIMTTRMIDIGKYHIAVFSAVDCNAQAGQTDITNASVLFYTFATKTWSCIEIEDTMAYSKLYAW